MTGTFEPVTSFEYAAALAEFNRADDSTPIGELRERIGGVVKAIREQSGSWAVHAEAFDMPGPGRVISVHPNEAEALTECIRLNREYDGDAGMYTTRRWFMEES